MLTEAEINSLRSLIGAITGLAATAQAIIENAAGELEMEEVPERTPRYLGDEQN